jgi:hypothetical protein
VRLSADAASDYDPESEDGEESPDATQNAIDGNRTTNWDTETYRAGLQGVHKSGVGLYVNAGSPLVARRLAHSTSTPGFIARVYGAANAVPSDISGWTAVSRPVTVTEDEEIPLDTRERRFRYYLLWITDLRGTQKAMIQELSLKK